ncbi:MAG: rod shape-determining protein RodA, partial [Spirochaetaceae bacterium]
MKRSSIFSIDLYIVGAVIMLIVIGVLFILSANTDTDGQIYNNEFWKQMIWAGIGLPLLFFFAFFNYQRLRDISLIIYIVIIVLLILTRLVGQVANRAHSWLGIGSVGIQPSEFAKIAVILFLGD